MSKKDGLTFLIFLTVTAIATQIANAQNLPQFSFPVDCTLGEDCWTVNYVDTDASPDIHKDYMCNRKTYEAHKGTDFAIRDRGKMREGVAVLAARAGKILRIRDGESDTVKTEEEFQAIRAANKDCGNGVIIDHGGSYESFYCHLKKGSVAVKPGDLVKTGQKIAEIGQSGFSEFPHLHFALIHEGSHLDPFTGQDMGEGCGKFTENLWKDDIQYEPFSVFAGGFTAGKPDFEAIKEGRAPETVTTDSPALVYWTGFYHAVAGDEIKLQIKDPDGHIFVDRLVTLEKNRKRPNFYYTGRKLENRRLKPGTYTGTAIFKRKSLEDHVVTHSIDIR